MTSLLTLRTCGVPGSARKELGCDARLPAVLCCQSYCDNPCHAHSFFTTAVGHVHSSPWFRLLLSCAWKTATCSWLLFLLKSDSRHLYLLTVLRMAQAHSTIQATLKPCTPARPLCSAAVLTVLAPWWNDVPLTGHKKLHTMKCAKSWYQNIL